MPRIPRLDRTLSSTIPFARGVADRAFRTAGPAVAGVVDRVSSYLPRRHEPEPPRPETFTPPPSAEQPTPAAADQVTDQVTHEARPATSTAPSPASVARNVAGPRPTAKSPAKRKPRSVPGAKLPVTRPSS